MKRFILMCGTVSAYRASARMRLVFAMSDGEVVKNMGKIVVVGSTNVDLAIRLSEWPRIGETVFGDGFGTSVGGKGANQAVAAARLGAETIFLSAVGADAFGEMARQKFSEEGLHTELHESSEHTGTALIDVGPDGSNIIKLAPGANWDLGVGFVQAKQDLVLGCDVLLLQNEIKLETSKAAAAIARRSDCLIIMDPASAPIPVWDDEVYAAFDVITPNATEAAAILGFDVETPEEGAKAAEALAKRFGIKAVVTLGGDGAAWSDGDICGYRPCPRVEAIDTVAAGDCSNGAFAAHYARIKSFEASVNFALKAGAMATTRRGAINSLPGDLEAQIEVFVDHYNHQRYHESLNNVTPADVYFGRDKAILRQRERIKRKTLEARRLHHRQHAA